MKLIKNMYLCTAFVAASLTKDCRSAPTKPGVSLASCSNETDELIRKSLDNTERIL